MRSATKWILSHALLQIFRSRADLINQINPASTETLEVKVMDRFFTQLTFSIGKLFLFSMFMPLGVMHGCPTRTKGPRGHRTTRER